MVCSELHENDISNVVVKCRMYSAISCRKFVFEPLETCLKRGVPEKAAFYNKLSWFVSELPEEDILNMVV